MGWRCLPFGIGSLVEQSLKQDSLEMEARTQRLRAGWDLSSLIEVVCAYFKIGVEQITDKGRRNTLSIAKSVICYLGTKELGLSSTDIASRLKMSQPSVSKSFKN